MNLYTFRQYYYCSIANYYESGTIPRKAKLLTVTSSIPSKKTTDEESTGSDDTWKEYEYTQNSKKIPVLYNTKDGIFITRTKDLEKAPYTQAKTTCENINFQLLSGNDIIKYIEKYDSKSGVFTDIDDCVWKDDKTCMSNKRD